MKRLLACVLMCALLTGCRGDVPYAREMGDMALLRAMGLDAGKPGVELTVSTAGRMGGEEALVLSAQGESISAAALAVQSLGDRYVYYGYVDQLLLGEELAAAGVQDVMDYLARESELGLGTQLWVVRGSTATQAIKTAGNRGIPQRLGQLNIDSKLGAAGITRTATELMSVLARQGSIGLPVLEWVAPREGDGGEGDGMLMPNGYGVMRQGKLVCWVEREAARGVELMEGRVFGHIEDLRLEDGAMVSLAAEDARTTARPVFRGEELIGVEIVCCLAARVVQASRPLQEEELEQLRFRLELLEGERIVQAVELGQYWDADYLDLKRKLQLASPYRKADVEEQWEGAFRGLDIRADVRAEVEGSFGIADRRR